MGIRASYLATGGIMTVLGLILGRAILQLLGGLAGTVGAVLLGAVAFMFKAALILIAVWVVLRIVKGRRHRSEA